MYETKRSILGDFIPVLVVGLMAVYLAWRGVASASNALTIISVLFMALTLLLLVRVLTLRASKNSVFAKLKPFFQSRGLDDSHFKRMMIHIALVTACVIAAYPVLRIFSISLRPGQSLTSTDMSIIPQNATFDHYRTVLFGDPITNRRGDFFLWIWNSLLVTAGTAMIGVILAATAAYSFSRFRFRGRTAGMIFFLTTQMIPAGMLLLPLFLMLANLNLTNTYLGLVIAYSVTSIPFSIWILKGYYDTIPFDLEEAAMIDGTSQLGAFWRILIPLSAPALAIVFLFNFMGSWSEFLVANVVIKTEMLRTWPLGLQEFSGSYTTAFGRFAATSILVAIPVMALFLYSSKWLLGGLTLGSVKG